jgi:hypothetical protein
MSVAFFDRSRSEGRTDADTVYVERTEYDVRRVDVPPMPEREVGAYLRFRLPSFYPGDATGVGFSFSVSGEGEGRFASVAIFDRSAVAALDSFKGRARTFSALAAPHLLGGDGICVFLGDDWAEEAVVESGLAVDVAHISRSESTDLPFGPGGVGLAVGDSEALAGYGRAGVRTMTWEEAAKQARSTKPAFESADRSPKIEPVALAVIAACFAIACASAGALVRAAAYDDAAAVYESRTAAARNLVAKLSSAVRSERPETGNEGPWGLLQAIHGLGIEGALIESFEYEKGKFSIEMRAEDALEALEKARSDPRFSPVALKRITPRTEGGESFVLTGSFDDDRE